MLSKRFHGAALMAAVTLTAVVGCGEDPLASACCTEFKVGADLSGVDFGVDASIKGQFNAFAQASADLSGAASGALDGVTGACKGMAQVGGANATADEPADPGARVKFWCDLAVAKIQASFQAQGGASAALNIQVTPAECKASFKAEANCQASCQVDASCDASAKPPTCEGGKLEVSCEGGCEGEANASIACEGGCTGTCEGSCTAEGGVAVDCEGKCEGTCTAKAGASDGGAQADGSCKGECNGTCTASATAPKVECKGTCKGSCSAKCEAKAGATVKCDGKCSGKAEPLSCKGGELKAQCEVNAECGGNCSASASAKAECTPPKLDIAFSASAQGSASGEAALMVEAIRLYLPEILLVFQARGKAFVDLTGKVVASGSATLDPGKLGLKGAACLGAIVPVVVQAGANVTAAFEASGKVAGQFSL
ncbi:MAG: hypothetical protein KF795_05310 [Labilithrix sp.]|nr:hypothetical protein [Labilithrix sp.]